MREIGIGIGIVRESKRDKKATQRSVIKKRLYPANPPTFQTEAFVYLCLAFVLVI